MILFYGSPLPYNTLISTPLFQIHVKEVMPVSARERILTIRILEKAAARPALAAALGIECGEESALVNEPEEPP